MSVHSVRIIIDSWYTDCGRASANPSMLLKKLTFPVVESILNVILSFIENPEGLKASRTPHIKLE